MSDDDLSSESDPPDAGGDVPDEYAMSSGERPEHIRRRNRLTGILLLLLVLIFVGITIYSRAVGW